MLTQRVSDFFSIKFAMKSEWQILFFYALLGFFCLGIPSTGFSAENLDEPEAANKIGLQTEEEIPSAFKIQKIPNKAYSLLASDEAKEWEAKRTNQPSSNQMLAKSEDESLEGNSEPSSEGNYNKHSRPATDMRVDKKKIQNTQDGTAETLEEGSSSRQSEDVLDSTKRETKKPNNQSKKKSVSALRSEKSHLTSPMANPFFTFPDWGVQSFDYFFNPIVGFASQRLDYPGYSRYFAVMEFGGQVGLSDIPVVAGNPGLTISGSVGSTLGSYQVVEGKNLDWKGTSSNYRRTFGDVTFSVYRHFFKDEIRLSRGVISYSNPDWKKSNLQSAGLSNDAGWRLNSALSAHYQLGIEKAWSEKFSDPTLTEWDNWIYGRLFYSPIKFRSDFGPGYQTVTQKSSADIFDANNSQESAGEIATSTSMPYVKLVLQVNPFWKLVAQSSSKWNLAAKTSLSSSTAQRLPQESIYDTKEIGLPGDSFTSGNFIGLAHLFGGLSVGYQVNLTITHLSDADKKQTNRTSGVALSYQVSL